MHGATLLEFGERNLVRLPKKIGFDPCRLTESDIFFHLRLRRSETVEEIALAAGGEVEHGEPDRGAVGVA